MLFVFDWDGTLLDSTGKIVTCMQGAAKEIGLPVCSQSEVENIIGLGLPEAIRVLYPLISDKDVSLLRNAYSQHYIRADKVHCAFFPKVQSVLSHLRGEGHHLAVATGKSRAGLNRVLGQTGIADYFISTRCADETASKPEPLMLLQILDELDMAANDAVMVGDTEYDLNMAHAAGMDSVGVTYGAHTRERLEACKPKLIIDEFEQLLTLLD